MMCLCILLIFHMIICVLVTFLTNKRILKSQKMLLWLVYFIPVCGIIMFFIHEDLLLRQKLGQVDLKMDRLKIERAQYKQIDLDDNENIGITVPLEEALFINDTKIRRNLMLNILRKDPDQYIRLLKTAGDSSDIEITHYATTTMLELQSSYEKKVRELAKKYKADGDNKDTINELIESMVKLINSELINGGILKIRRQQLIEILLKCLQKEPRNKYYYFLVIEQSLKLKQNLQVKTYLEKANEYWPEDEKVYMFWVDYYRKTHQGTKIQEILEKVLKENIYLTKTGREWFAFWYKGANME